MVKSTFYQYYFLSRIKYFISQSFVLTQYITIILFLRIKRNTQLLVYNLSQINKFLFEKITKIHHSIFKKCNLLLLNSS
ncbi:hypothetical protein pb186bvf_001807 [Paramecium bursaria]